MVAVTWSVKVIPQQTSQAVPALAVRGNRLHIVYLGAGDQKIRHAVFAGDDWTPMGIIKDHEGKNEQSSQAVPALAALGNRLHIVYLGAGDQKIRHAVFAASDWTPKGIIKNQSSQAPPALAALGGQLHMVYLEEHDQKIRHAIGTITP